MKKARDLPTYSKVWMFWNLKVESDLKRALREYIKFHEKECATNKESTFRRSK